MTREMKNSLLNVKKKSKIPYWQYSIYWQQWSFLLCGHSLYLNTASYFSVFDQQLWLISHFKLTSNIATGSAVPDHLSGLKRDGVDY